ncbi:DMT family transporter [Roseomonas marmotae]|uniref:EamA family transporter n=1 Tax=Roseomonas marmotae TaxID=2768161 RepID=A0ABS3KDB5_9PROT|nr:EamA family transporter [Roseomonas marmotae]MBO1075472.1 EamA family transporter [Roseomonas marmotae]QTI81421.1 EamA family transporter [Roseomonas marmotae]
MTPSTLALILVSVTMSAAAQVLLKFGVQAARPAPGMELPMLAALFRTLFHPLVLGGLALYGLGAVLWIGALGRTELSKAYPFVSLGFVLTAAAGALLFHETLSMLRVSGIALIVIGVILVAQS